MKHQIIMIIVAVRSTIKVDSLIQIGPQDAIAQWHWNQWRNVSRWMIGDTFLKGMFGMIIKIVVMTTVIICG